MINHCKISAKNISKSFLPGVSVLRGVSMEIAPGKVYGVTGPNGSGKSTLLKILAGLLRPDTGFLEYKIDGKRSAYETIKNAFGFSAPYINLYEEFTPVEHIKIVLAMKGETASRENSLKSLEEFGLSQFSDRIIKTFSSGMKQRMRLILSSLNNPAIIFMDEPTSNLDSAGVAAVEKFIGNGVAKGASCVVATNEEREIEMCDELTELSN